MDLLQPLIHVDDLSFRYRSGSAPTLSHINFSVLPGEFVGVTGPAGAGKTTLLSCLNGVIPHYYTGELSGKVAVCGLEVKESGFSELAQHIGTVFEDPDFQMVSISVEEEVAFGPENLGIAPGEIEVRVQGALRKTNISDLRGCTISTLSGGQKQRVAIAAVLSMLPRVLLLDEPTSELDPIGTYEIFSAIRNLNRQEGITVIVVSQKMEMLVENADRILTLSGGNLIMDAPPRVVCMRQDMLHDIGVRPPQASEFMISIYAELGRPFSSEDVCLNVEEAIPRLKELLEGNGNRERSLRPQS